MEELVGSSPSEVYRQFEEIIDERSIVYPTSYIIDEEVTVESLDFNRIEGLKKFYDISMSDREVEVSVEADEVDGLLEREGYELSSIDSINDGGRLGNYLEEYFSIEEDSVSRTF